MKKLFSLISALSLLLIISSCSSTEQTTKTETPAKKDSVYVFDEVPVDTTINVKQPQEPVVQVPFPPAEVEKYYIVQIGAFTTKDKAETFAEMSRKKLNKEVVVIYSNQVNLFVVQLTTLYALRDGAEKARNELWQIPEFKDAWILTVSK